MLSCDLDSRPNFDLSSWVGKIKSPTVYFQYGLHGSIRKKWRDRLGPSTSMDRGTGIKADTSDGDGSNLPRCSDAIGSSSYRIDSIAASTGLNGWS